MRDFIRLGGVLFIITAAVALVLAVGNNATFQKIDDRTAQAKINAQQDVLKGVGTVLEDTATKIDVKEGTAVKEITEFTTESGEVAFAVACSPKGYGGEISMMVGINQDLNVTGISIIDNAKETPGLGARVGEPKFYEQYMGKLKNIGISKSVPKDNEIQAITGATISSKAVTKGVNDAINAVGEVLGK